MELISGKFKNSEWRDDTEFEVVLYGVPILSCSKLKSVTTKDGAEEFTVRETEGILGDGKKGGELERCFYK